MKRILIDLTDIENWAGHHGGTQRVVYGITKQFFLHKSDTYEIKYIAFSPRQNSFYSTDFEPIYERTESQAVASMQTVVPASTSLQTRVKQSLRLYIPERLRKSKRARVAARHTLRVSKGLARKAKQKIHQHKSSTHAAAGHKITFTENDIVLILGKPWDNPTMEQALTSEKAKTGFKLVQVVYDLIIPLYPHLHHPSLFRNYTQYMFEAIYNSDLLLPISKSSDEDLKKFAGPLNLPLPQTKILRLADNISGQEASQISKPDGRIEDDFIVCVGTVEIRKNHMLLYYAYKLAEQHGIKLPQLVIVGSRGWLTDDFQYLVKHDPNIKDKILILDNLNDQGLVWIYANCLFTIYPSFYEGWGLPVAESLASGKVCIASNISSIPEIAGDLIDYFSPYNAQACLDLMVKYLDTETRQKKETQISKTYRTTGWEDAFKKVASSLRELKD
jgi:glycosyltransferase involved in cell wall biosynthesis